MLNTVSGSLVQKGRRSLKMRISLLRRHCWSWHYELECLFILAPVLFLISSCFLAGFGVPSFNARSNPATLLGVNPPQHFVLEKTHTSSQTPRFQGRPCHFTTASTWANYSSWSLSFRNLVFKQETCLIKWFGGLHETRWGKDLASCPANNLCSRSVSFVNQLLSGCPFLCSWFWKVDTIFLYNSFSRSEF